MPSLDDKIDDLYKAPLADFTSARNALAKSLTGDEAKRVRALAKPTVVAWAINQVYWRARAAYDRLLKAGERLRKAQIAALEGKSADVRAATEAHRHAIADVVGEAERLAADAGSKPGADPLSRTFEALSLAPALPEAPGRLTEALQPAGFEALVGITPTQTSHKSSVVSHQSEVFSHQSAVASQKSAVASQKSQVGSHKPQVGSHKPQVGSHKPHTPGPTRAERHAAEKEERERTEREAAARKREAELRKADAAVARAEANEKLARATWERAHDALLDARRARDAVRTRRPDA